MSTKTPLPTVNEKATESVSIKGLFVGRVSSKLAQLLRHCIRLSVKVHPEGGLVVVEVFPPICCGLVAFYAAFQRCSFTLGVPLCWWIVNKRILSVKHAIRVDLLPTVWHFVLHKTLPSQSVWPYVLMRLQVIGMKSGYLGPTAADITTVLCLLILAGNSELASASLLARRPVTQEFWPFRVPNTDFVAPASPWHTEHPVCPSDVKVAEVQQRCDHPPAFQNKRLRGRCGTGRASFLSTVLTWFFKMGKK